MNDLGAGSRVRLRTDPARVGLTTGHRRERRGKTLLQVQFPSDLQYIPADKLEPFTADDPLAQFRAGRFGTARDLRRSLAHVRLTGRLANVIYSMDTTGTDFYAYQYKPVVKLLNSNTTGLLIADEVGLGKTIEAGLIWTELRARFDFRRLLVLCPAVLRTKWKLELKKRFGVDAEIVDAAGAADRMREAADDPHRASFHMIASMQGLRAPRSGGDGPAAKLDKLLRAQADESPLVDLLIVDEAHYLRNRGTQTAALGRALREVSAYVVLLSATPIHLGQNDLYQLLNLVDEQTFDEPAMFDEILEANEPLVRARDLIMRGEGGRGELEEILQEAGGRPLLRENHQLQALRKRLAEDCDLQDPEVVSHLAHRLERVNLLGHVVTRTRKRDVTGRRVVRHATAERVEPNEFERSFYQEVTRTVRQYCMQVGGPEGFLLTTPQRQMASSMPAAFMRWSGQALPASGEELTDLEPFDEGDVEWAEQGPLIQELMLRVGELADARELWKHDSKYARLKSELGQFLRKNPGEKVVLFSYFRDTLNYLEHRLREDGIRAIVMHGGIARDKDETLELFQRQDGPSVLLSSEVGAEGIDLQFCWVVINYDLPWNPMRVEQRIGRIDRLGQESPKIHVWNLFYEDTIDSRIHDRLFQRLELFENALGSLEAVLGDSIHRLTVDLLSQDLTPEEEDRRIEQTARALENLRREEEQLESEAAHLVAHGDHILNEVNAARELERTVRAADIRGYVLDFFTLNYPGCEFLQLDDSGHEFRISLSDQAKHDFEAFLQAERLFGLTRLTRNAPTPVQCRFENTVLGTGSQQVEVISQFHPVVRFAGRQVDGEDQQRNPAVAVRVPTSDVKHPIEPGAYVFAVQRWSVQGMQDIEKLWFSVVPLDHDSGPLDPEAAERLVGAASQAGVDWHEAVGEVDLALAERTLNEHCLGHADDSYEEYVADLEAENEDRADLQLQALTKHADRQLAKLAEVRQKHVEVGRDGLARATEGRMKSLKARVERRRIQIEERRWLRHHASDVCVGIIQVR